MLPFPRLGESSSAYAWSFTLSGIRIGFDVVLFEQTGALIAALRLKDANVLGWSMGSMIAQARAILHPSQVRRLILCAGSPGNGAAVRPSQRAINALNSGNRNQVMADLFPADRVGARNSYLAALSSYPVVPPPPRSVISAQAAAVEQWWSGRDPAGRRPSAITSPTLIADGTLDRLDSTANSRILATVIRRATLRLYPAAGHAFLFQDQAAFVAEIASFLGGPPNPM